MHAHVRSAALLCCAFLFVGCPSNDGPTPPPPYAGSLETAPECELSADCPAGTYCDLGQCFQQCNTIDPCAAGSTCLNRGRCAANSHESQDAPVEVTTVPTVAVTAQDVFIDENDASATIQLTASGTGEVRYRVDSRVSWLHDPTPSRGTFTSALTLMLAVDRAGLSVGDHVGTVVVHTTSGSVVVNVHLRQGLTAIYEGDVEYTSPRHMGTAQMRIAVVEDQGFASVQVVSAQSPLFPTSSGLGPTGTAVASGGTLTGSIRQRIESADLTLRANDNYLNRAVGRQFTYTLTATSGGGLAGTFTERWYGIFGTPVEVTGTINLARLGREPVPTFVVGADPQLPSNPSTAAPVVSAACRTLAGNAASPTVCTQGTSASNLLTCGTVVEGYADKLDANFNIAFANSGYEAMTTACSADVYLQGGSSTYGMVSNVVPTCIHRANLDCALSLYGDSLTAGGADPARDGVRSVVNDWMSVGLLLLNDSVTDAFRIPYQTATYQNSAVPAAVKSRLAQGLQDSSQALAVAFSPFALEQLRSTPTAANDPEAITALRRIAQLVSLRHTALQQYTDVDIYTNADRASVQNQAGRDALNLLLGLVAVSEIEHGVKGTQATPSYPELALFDEALSQLNQRFVAISHADTPFGLPDGYVEFIYDDANPATTNYGQVLAAHQGDIANGVALEDAARTAIITYETNVSGVSDALAGVIRQYNTRLVEICGALPGQDTVPNLAGCGTNGTTGQLAIALSRRTEAQGQLNTARERAAALQSRAQIQTKRMADVFNIQAESIAYVDRTGHQINALEFQVRQLANVEAMLATAAGTGLTTPGAAGAAAAQYAVGTIRNVIQLSTDDLRLAQELELMTNQQDIEWVNANAALQELLVDQATLALEVANAVNALATSNLEATTLVQTKRTMVAERDFETAQVLAGIGNDPTFRVTRDEAVLDAIRGRERARRSAYLIARAFELETNTDLPSIETTLLPAMRVSQMSSFLTCVMSEWGNSQTGLGGAPQMKVDEISVREDILGIRGPITDSVTGERLTEAEQFQRYLLAPSNLPRGGALTGDPTRDGAVGFAFVTSLRAGNGVFSTLVCNDVLVGIEAKIIGDGLGDNQATLLIEHGGSSVVRSCTSFHSGANEDVIETYDLGSRVSEVNTGVNAYPDSSLDRQLFGRPVAASAWRIAIPTGTDAPRNVDVDPTRIEDIVLRITHRAITINSTAPGFHPMCALN